MICQEAAEEEAQAAELQRGTLRTQDAAASSQPPASFQPPPAEGRRGGGGGRGAAEAEAAVLQRALDRATAALEQACLFA